jgi:hypothetical protein
MFAILLIEQKSFLDVVGDLDSELHVVLEGSGIHILDDPVSPLESERHPPDKRWFMVYAASNCILSHLDGLHQVDFRAFHGDSG